MAASRSQSSEATIVWEFEGDISGLMTPYSDKVSNFIEDEYTKNPSATIYLKHADPLLKSFEVNLGLKVQNNPQTGSRRKIDRKIYDAVSTIGGGIIWEWLTDNGWIAYDIESLDAIEAGYLRKDKEFDLENLSYGLPNVILLQKGYQKNKHSGFVRPIQRRNVNYRTIKKKKQASERAAKKTKSNTKTFTNDNHKMFKFCSITTDIKKDEDCPICLATFDEPDLSDDENQAVELKKCKHKFHVSCMKAYCDQGTKNGCIQCPLCKTIHGIKTGNQPPGIMDVIVNMHQSVAGYQGCGMITISYDIHRGIQGAEHPQPGSPYFVYGFPRTCYLPNNQKGKEVLALLKLAWDRRLIFTVGLSTTTGIDNSVIWNDIHHKTSTHDSHSQGHGYPDPLYLDNVIEELKQHGVTMDDVKNTSMTS